MFQQFFCCSYSVINHLAGRRTHTGLNRQLILWHAAIILQLVKKQIHSHLQVRAAKTGKAATQYSNNLQETSSLVWKEDPGITVSYNMLFHGFAFGHCFQEKRQLLTCKIHSLSLHKQLLKEVPAAWWWETLRSVIQSPLLSSILLI